MYLYGLNSNFQTSCLFTLAEKFTIWRIRANGCSVFVPKARPQQGDLRFSRPPSSQSAGGGAQARDKRIAADLWVNEPDDLGKKALTLGFGVDVSEGCDKEISLSSGKKKQSKQRILIMGVKGQERTQQRSEKILIVFLAPVEDSGGGFKPAIDRALHLSRKLVNY
ncbi:hypothetical protein PoB_000256600 [Plakobranchus ocellatus]|uniref:Uncharacterized protein n=1 Tax=Plakobranchus ocellatus TaxID=259542 RepID=A0AAV3Y150_9GAST|nr:hypothetical protein PoB_000256600 [Plakobranchus ocellatus]